MKLMMIMGAGGCFIVALALGYVQENTAHNPAACGHRYVDRTFPRPLVGLDPATSTLRRRHRKNEFIKRRANSVRRGGSIGNT